MVNADEMQSLARGRPLTLVVTVVDSEVAYATLFRFDVHLPYDKCVINEAVDANACTVVDVREWDLVTGWTHPKDLEPGSAFIHDCYLLPNRIYC